MQKPIPDIIAFILDIIYGQITPQDLSDGKDEVRYFAYKPWKPIDLVFNKITKFKDLCKLCKEKKRATSSAASLSYLIFNETRVFTNALKEWNKFPAADKTYTKMKTLMRTHH